MPKIEYDEHLADLKGSEQHHDLKGRPGEKGAPDHAQGDGTLSDEVAQHIEAADDETQIAAELKSAVKGDDA